MSQAKVDQYKKEKANRKKLVAQARVKRICARIAGYAVAVAIIVWAGFSGYKLYQDNRPAKTYTVSTGVVEDYISGLTD